MYGRTRLGVGVARARIDGYAHTDIMSNGCASLDFVHTCKATAYTKSRRVEYPLLAKGVEEWHIKDMCFYGAVGSPSSKLGRPKGSVAELRFACVCHEVLAHVGCVSTTRPCRTKGGVLTRGQSEKCGNVPRHTSRSRRHCGWSQLRTSNRSNLSVLCMVAGWDGSQALHNFVPSADGSLCEWVAAHLKPPIILATAHMRNNNQLPL